RCEKIQGQIPHLTGAAEKEGVDHPFPRRPFPSNDEKEKKSDAVKSDFPFPKPQPTQVFCVQRRDRPPFQPSVYRTFGHGCSNSFHSSLKWSRNRGWLRVSRGSALRSSCGKVMTCWICPVLRERTIIRSARASASSRSWV